MSQFSAPNIDLGSGGAAASYFPAHTAPTPAGFDLASQHLSNQFSTIQLNYDSAVAPALAAADASKSGLLTETSSSFGANTVDPSVVEVSARRSAPTNPGPSAEELNVAPNNSPQVPSGAPTDFASTFVTGPNFDKNGQANFSDGSKYDLVNEFDAGPNFDRNGNTTFKGELPELPAADLSLPAASGAPASGPAHPAAGFAKAGMDTSWAMNAGAMYNMNDLIGYFDVRISEMSRSSVFGAGFASSSSYFTTGGTFEAGKATGPVPSMADLKGEIDDLGLKLEKAVAEGNMSQTDANRVMKDFETRANKLDAGPETDQKVEVKRGSTWSIGRFVGADARMHLRELIESITLIPVDGKLEIELVGALAGLLALGEQGAVQQKTARIEGSTDRSVSLVAGVGFEPTTFRL